MERIFVSADIEGVCGIADWNETEVANAQGAQFRARMTDEVAAACEAAVSRGAKDILVKDAHGSGRNIDATRLPECARLIRAWTRDPMSMMAGLESTHEGVILVGYHSAAGTDGNPLAHTMNGQNVWVKINGEYASEFLINAYTAASVGVPVLFLSGDEALCATAEAMDWGIRTMAVSRGVGNASVSIHPAAALRGIREGVAGAMDDPPEPSAQVLPARFTVEIRFKEHALARRGAFYPGARATGSHTVEFRSRTWKDALTFLFFVL